MRNYIIHKSNFPLTLFFYLFIILCYSIEVTAGTKTVHVNFERSDIIFSKQGEYDVLSLSVPSGLQDSTKVGEPKLPVKTIRLILPAQTEVKSVRVVSKSEMAIEGRYNLSI
jgi:hypothetical protein